MKLRSKWTVFMLFFISCAIAGGLFLSYISMSLPDVEQLASYEPSIPSQILSSDGEVLLESGSENRELVELEKIPKVLINSFIAAEDDNFYSHKGVDYKGLMRAMMKNVMAGRIVQGGSTITQQVAKSILLTSEKTYIRKLKDFMLALKIEKRFSKEEILYFYLNQVYLGGGYYGIKQAIQGYFDKELDEVTIAESAMMAGLLVAPSSYSPYRNPEAAKKRQAYVLSRLFETGIISEEEYNIAKSEKMKFRIRKSSDVKGGHFTNAVMLHAIDKVGKEEFLNNGYKIETTLNWRLQKTANKAIKVGLRDIDKRQGFKGPLKNIKQEEYKDFLHASKIEILKENSSFFWVDTEGQVEYEYNLPEESVEKKVEENKLKFVGNKKEDPITEVLKTDEDYEAIVLKVDDRFKIVLASVAGSVGIIKKEGFSWAYKRDISDKAQYRPLIDKPSEILKPGDVIHVRINNKNVPFEKIVGADDYKNFIKAKNKENQSSELFNEYKLEQIPEVEGALVSINPHTGALVSMIGGRDFSLSKFNRATQSRRQPGSSFKPFLYAAALEKGYTPASILYDTPEALGGNRENLSWKPQNYDGKFKGPITFRRSLEVSRNVTTIKLAEDIGVQNILDFLKRIDFKAEIQPDLSLSLGSFGITLLDLVSSYAVFPARGKIVKVFSISKVIDRNGVELDPSEFDPMLRVEEENSSSSSSSLSEGEDLSVEEKNKEIAENNEESSSSSADTEEDKYLKMFVKHLNETQVYDERLSYLMANLLKGVVQNGTGRKARGLSTYIGGKTGTTNNYVDAWFLGFTSRLALGVWTGFDNNNTLGFGETGSKSALPIWIEYMQEAIEFFGDADFSPPRGIINVAIDPDTGKIPAFGGPKIIEAFVEGTEPGSKTDEPMNIDDLKTQEIYEDDSFYD